MTDENSSVANSEVRLSRPKSQIFHDLIQIQLNAQHQDIREAFKEMVGLVTDTYTARLCLDNLRSPLKTNTALIQLKTLSILGACVKNCVHEFHVELATKKWMDRLLRVIRTCRDDRVRDKVLQLVSDWCARFEGQPQLQEFSIASHRLKAKGVELPPPSEPREKKTRQRPAKTAAAATSETAAVARTSASKPAATAAQDPRTAQLTALEILMENIQADASNLELGLQRAEMLQEGIAQECRRHLQKIQVILSTDLPDQAMYEFIELSDHLHELLGLYDAIFTDSAPEEIHQEKEASAMKLLEDEIRAEKKLKAEKLKDLEELKAELAKAQQEWAIAMEKEKAKATKRDHKHKANHDKLMQVMSKAADIKSLTGDCKKLLKDEKTKMTSSNKKFAKELAESLNQFPIVVEALRQGESKAFTNLKKLYTLEVNTRKKLYNKLQELRGNIRVYCRVRPINKKEIEKGEAEIVSFPAEGEIVIKDGSKQRAFEFDLCFPGDTKQEEVFEDTKPLINCVVDGYKVCIFAYGQTGSGKTFTMQGPKDYPGINRRALNRLFELIQERVEVEKSTVHVSVLEIYNETIRDLLNNEPGSDKLKYDIKTHPEEGQYVENLTSYAVTRVDEIDHYMARAEKNRSSGKTNMNEHSSRSHMLLYIVVRTKNLNSGVTTIGKLSLVDLAGSERLNKSGAKGDRMKEAQAINKSLSALGDVISSLSRNDSHIPYRNSKLTHLLKDSLGGNSKCLMFCNVSPASYNANESINSLQFAFRARGVVLGPAKRNMETK